MLLAKIIFCALEEDKCLPSGKIGVSKPFGNDFITSIDNKWTIIVSSKNPYWKTKCDRKITMQKGIIQLDLNT